MFKKFLVASSLLVLSLNVAQANPSPYLGANIGMNLNTIDNGSTNFPGNQIGTNYRGVPFNVFAGFGGSVSESFYLAGEVNATLGNATVSNNGNLKTTYGFGASVIPGIMLSDHTLGFVRGGVVDTKFSDIKANRTGVQIGAGMQTSLTSNVDLRGEYDFTGYKSINKFDFSGNPHSDTFNVGLLYKFE